MTKQLTRQEVEAVVERFLPENKLCNLGIEKCYFCKFQPVYIMEVLSKIDKKVGGRNYYIGQTTYNDELIHLWSRCGELTQSLQEIIEESGWECKLVAQESDTSIRKVEILTSPEANALFSFLLQIGL